MSRWPEGSVAAMTTTNVLITGANKGIGYATAHGLAERGYTVLLGARDPGRGAAAAQRLGVRFVELDVTSDESVRAAVKQVGTDYGVLDVLINNAGIAGPIGPSTEVTAEQLREVYEINVLGPVRVTNAFLPLLRAARAPRIVLVSSTLGSIATHVDPTARQGPEVLPYASAKAALNMITAQYATALPGFQVNAVCPGHTATDLNGFQGQQTPEEGSAAIVELATSGPDGPTGQFLNRFGALPW